MPFFTQISLLRIHQMSLKSDKTNETYGFSVFFLCVNLQNPRNSSSHDNYGPTTQENRKTWIAIITIQDYDEPKHYNCSITQTETIVFIIFFFLQKFTILSIPNTYNFRQLSFDKTWSIPWIFVFWLSETIKILWFFGVFFVFVFFFQRYDLQDRMVTTCLKINIKVFKKRVTM